ncbi:hypothetical protein GCK72_012410 [Caenorhabditis remanei]|uniref:DUF38 domain-containing protein n=1 Tax=Caenorhabditis remanei TaxID=31234 RepID=A0A6A5GKU4_CAERE|nr:hypothetical protein GCK72_012410 [Caenorhabditis remanei]KAF1755957.1 hypothetical protein GCK72_012410 [Caenorhabditis remanei]
MGSKFPDPSLSFTSSETGSDVLKVISKFINNTEVPICGSRIFILLKRFPNEQDITELIAQMRKYRVYVYIATSLPPSGGSHPETIRRLTTQTNGLDYYYEDSSFTLSNYESMVSKTIYFNASAYDMQVDYEIGDAVVYAVQIRMYTTGSDGYWIPYDD